MKRETPGWQQVAAFLALCWFVDRLNEEGRVSYEDPDNQGEDDWEKRAREPEPLGPASPLGPGRPGTRRLYITRGSVLCPRYPAHPINLRADGAMWCHVCAEIFYPADEADYAAWVAALPEQREAA